MTGADNRRDDRFHLLTQVFLEGGLPFVGADVAAGGVVTGAIGQELALLIDDRDALRPQAAHSGGDEMADGAHLLRLQSAAELEYDRRRRLDLVARK